MVSIFNTNRRTQTVPFHLSTPQDVLLAVHEDGEMLVFPLLHRVGARCYRSQLFKLQFQSKDRQTDGHILILQPSICTAKILKACASEAGR